MAEGGGAELGRVCPSCGRRVPRYVAVCRCGSSLSAAPGQDGGVPRPRRRAGLPTSAVVLPVVVAALALAAVAVLGLRWPARAPAPAPPAAAEPVPAETTAEVEPEEPVPAGDAAKAAPEWPELGIAVTERTPPAPQPAAALSADPALEDVVARVMPAVVRLRTSTGSGSGFYVAPGTLVTNAHVVGTDRAVTVQHADGRLVTARVERVWAAVDLAVVTSAAAAGQVTIPLGSASRLRPGQEVFTIGSALGMLQNSVSRGIVSGLRRSGAATLVQTDAAANPGNSGGPLLDRQGVAVGVTTMGYREFQGLNFAVAAEHVRAIVDGGPEPSGPAPTATTAVQSRGDTVSEGDRLRADGERAFEQAVAELGRAADRLDAEWPRYRAQCYAGRVVGAFTRAWAALIVPGALADAVNPRCASYHADLARAAGEIRGRLADASDAARRAGVYPGVIRDARRRHRLDDEALGR